jgi:rod shape-determining protein MreC
LAFRESPLGELKIPLTWTAAVAVVVAGVIAVALLVSDRRENLQEEAYGAARKTVDTVAAPVSGAIAAPGRWTGQGLSWISVYLFTASENRKLRRELDEMRSWRDTAIGLKEQNDRYQALLGLKLNPPIPIVAARVVADSRGPFANARIADTGRSRGVNVGNPVMSERGLVGRVVGVTNSASRVLLLTDIASRTPVMIDRTNARAILTGDGGPNPKLEYLRRDDSVKAGDLVVTSGDGGVLPRGLPVGVAVKDILGNWRVALAADNASIDFVQIIKFVDFSQLADIKALSEAEMPPVTTKDPQATVLRPNAAVQAPQALNSPKVTAIVAPLAPMPRPLPKPVSRRPVTRPAASPLTPVQAVAPPPPPVAATVAAPQLISPATPQFNGRR